MFFLPPILWLLVFAVTMIVMSLLKEKDVLVLVYSAFALFTPAMVQFVFGLGMGRSCFDMALSFGCTRKRALGLVLGHLLLCTGLMVLLSLGFYHLDNFLTPRAVAALVGFDSFHPIGQAGSGLAVEFLTVPLWWFLLPFAAMLAGFAAGVLVRRFGQRAGWALYALFMFVLLSYNSGAAWLTELGPLVIGALVLLTGGGFVWAVHDLLHTSVKL